MNRKILAFFLAVMLLMSAVPALAADINMDVMYPIVDEPVTMSMAILKGVSAGNPDEMWFWPSYERKTNVKWEITQIDNAIWGDRKTILLASGDYPDVFFGPQFTNSEIMKYGAEGIFIPLNDLIGEYATNLNVMLSDVVPEAVAGITCPDGNIYSMPHFSMGNIWSSMRMWIHESWLTALGIAMPETLDEFYDALLAFKNDDPNGNGEADEIPWSGSWEEGPQGYQVVLNALGFVTGGGYAAMKDGEAVFTPLHPDFKTYLEFMKKCWDSGLIDPDMFTQTQTQYRAKSATNVVGFSADAAPFLMTGYEITYEEYSHIMPLVVNKGDTPVYWYGNTYGIGYMEITDACATPEIAVRWADIFYDAKEAFQAIQGPIYGTEDDPNLIGWEIKETENEDGTTNPPAPWARWGADEEHAAIVNPDGLGAWDFFCRYIGPRDKGTPWYMGLDDAYALQVGYGINYNFIGGEKAWRDSQMEIASPYFTLGWPNVFFSDEDNATLNELGTPLNDYVRSMEAKFITGAEDMAGYDNFIAELNRLGADKIDAIYRATVAAALGTAN